MRRLPAVALSRRRLLAGGAALGGLAALGSLRLPRPVSAAAESVGYGPLLPDAAGILDLPAGFSYAVLARVGDPMLGGAPRRPGSTAWGRSAAPGAEPC